MDKASASGAGDSRFESWAGHFECDVVCGHLIVSGRERTDKSVSRQSSWWGRNMKHIWRLDFGHGLRHRFFMLRRWEPPCLRSLKPHSIRSSSFELRASSFEPCGGKDIEVVKSTLHLSSEVSHSSKRKRRSEEENERQLSLRILSFCNHL